MDAAKVIDDLVAEQDRIEAILAGLDEEAWLSPSAAAGWSIADVVLHLAQTEEAVIVTLEASDIAAREGIWQSTEPVDAIAERLVSTERTAPEVIFNRWRTARRAAVDALRAADPDRRHTWAAAPLKPRTLATTRLAEHWAHALDITDPLGIPYPDTVRLRHIAWLGHATLPYAFALAGEDAHDVFCTLTAPDGSTWRFGPPDADSTVTGPAGAFCRVGARRLRPEASGLLTSGPHADAALRVLRNYAG
jgi:uncharacterized protein (TIGR03084 family)